MKIKSKINWTILIIFAVLLIVFLFIVLCKGKKEGLIERKTTIGFSEKGAIGLTVEEKFQPEPEKPKASISEHIPESVKEILKLEPQQALTRYHQLMNQYPGLDFGREIYHVMAYNYSLLGRFEESTNEIKKALTFAMNKKDSSRTFSNWGVNLIILGRHNEAIQKFQMAVNYDSKNDEAYYNWGTALMSLHKYLDAIEKFKKALEINPRHVNAYYNWGVALGKLGKYEQAIENYKKVIEINPKNADAYYGWGWALGNLGRYEEAIEKYKKAIEINPNDPRSYYNLARAQSNLKQNKEAIENLKKAIELDPERKEKAKTDEDFDNLRNDPEFKKLVEE